MNRREFLKCCSLLGASVALGRTSADAKWLTNEKANGFPQGMLVIDAHAHPDIFPCTDFFCDKTSTLEDIMNIGMNASCFAVVEDENPAGGFQRLIGHLLDVIALEAEGKIKIMRRRSDLPHSSHPPGFTPGAILAVEGATPLETDPNRIDELYDLGVRLITPMHKKINLIGDIMTAVPSNGGLTAVGQQMVERMVSLGIIVDIAHAHINTLQGVAEIARINDVPIIDSHTSLTHRENPYGTTRLRAFEEMEMIAETGGVVCTWPMGWYVDDSHHRTSFLDWAKENLEIAREIGIEHVGLGTDGGGGLPALIDDYESILDLPKLVEAMDEVGFKRSEIAAYMGGNLFRVMKQCIG